MISLYCTSQKSLLHEESLFHVYKWIANDFSTKMYYKLFLLSKCTENQEDFPKICQNKISEWVGKWEFLCEAWCSFLVVQWPKMIEITDRLKDFFFFFWSMSPSLIFSKALFIEINANYHSCNLNSLSYSHFQSRCPLHHLTINIGGLKAILL